tara:strand:- start:455 stop:607 length:153 start_codon:yes stop_codon:yes gene_type:complete
MTEDKSVELLMKVLEKRDEAKKYMETYRKLMKECDKSIEKLRKYSGWEIE